MEIKRFVDQKRRAVSAFIDKHADSLRMQGTVQKSFRTYKGKSVGPYYRLSFRAGGIQRSQYLGQDPSFAAEVAELLAQLQGPRRVELALDRASRVLGAALRQQLRETDCLLSAHGYRRKGSAIHRRRFVNLPSLADGDS